MKGNVTITLLNDFDNKEEKNCEKYNCVRKGGEILSKSKSQQEREWTVRKQDQNPHDKVKSLKQLSKETDQGR